ncbi:MAG: hypothetical protein NTX72_00895 [Candidatus Uhrbacteria bacterium]|nr:hypothetical protein [Candidatus Uhrbacteria bacterium]
MSDSKKKPENRDPLIVVDIIRSFAPPAFKPSLPSGYNPTPIGSMKLSDRTEKHSLFGSGVYPKGLAHSDFLSALIPENVVNHQTGIYGTDEDEAFVPKNQDWMKELLIDLTRHFSRHFAESALRASRSEMLRLQRKDSIFPATGNLSELTVGAFCNPLFEGSHDFLYDPRMRDPDRKATERYYGGHRYSRYLGFIDRERNFKAYLKFDENGGYEENEFAH